MVAAAIPLIEIPDHAARVALSSHWRIAHLPQSRGRAQARRMRAQHRCKAGGAPLANNASLHLKSAIEGVRIGNARAVSPTRFPGCMSNALRRRGRARKEIAARVAVERPAFDRSRPPATVNPRAPGKKARTSNARPRSGATRAARTDRGWRASVSAAMPSSRMGSDMRMETYRAPGAPPTGAESSMARSAKTRPWPDVMNRRARTKHRYQHTAYRFCAMHYVAEIGQQKIRVGTEQMIDQRAIALGLVGREASSMASSTAASSRFCSAKSADQPTRRKSSTSFVFKPNTGMFSGPPSPLPFSILAPSQVPMVGVPRSARLHVAGARGFRACGGDLLRQIGCWHDALRQRNAVVRQKHRLQFSPARGS